MKKITLVFLSLICLVSLNLAFAGSPKATDGGGQTTTDKPRFQR
jgi:hypothetical protein